MINKNGAHAKFEILSQESYKELKKKHDELKEKNKKIRESLCEEGNCELDTSKLADK